ncbi:hypothetical protein COV20_05265 [Candidatus Woesearchaeota archaeon CG10_big_fil_rev_8_21_14_0_10_45_16]|nr:MAG: hypothetical protein COV20_05265 [Candidatus Woesearchaeota archaeon CG10_big_fil_rev_8_21_14_0_10_45_16]
MPKKSISSLELAAIVNELQLLVRGKVSQIYHQDKKELLLQLHAPGKGKVLLKIIPGKYVCLTEQKDTPLRPTGFCMLLRKHINNAIIRSIQQKDSERILIFELEKEEKFSLVIELFSKGNVVLLDKEGIIIGTLEWQRWKDRIVKPKERYVFPEAAFDWKKMSEKQLQDLFSKSDKKSVVVTLATEIGLGGLYAEEICRLLGIDKSISPREIDQGTIKKINKTIKEFLKHIETPQGYIYEEEVTPFPLQSQEEKKKTELYSQALDTLNPFQKVSPYDQKIRTLEKMVEGQEKAIEELQEKITLNGKRGDTIYESYAKLQKLRDIVDEMKKTAGWQEIETALKKEKKIKTVDLKNKRVLIDL